jgi:hypothetical protein
MRKNSYFVVFNLRHAGLCLLSEMSFFPEERRNPRMLQLCCGTKSASRAIKRLWPHAEIISSTWTRRTCRRYWLT